MSRKDYIDNWQSEMHETFCFWDFSEWKQNLMEAGFTVPLESKAYPNEWIINNRLQGKVQLFLNSDTPTPLPFPDMNMILLGVKE
jgi:hypothetical protein